MQRPNRFSPRASRNSAKVSVGVISKETVNLVVLVLTHLIERYFNRSLLSLLRTVTLCCRLWPAQRKPSSRPFCWMSLTAQSRRSRCVQLATDLREKKHQHRCSLCRSKASGRPHTLTRNLLQFFFAPFNRSGISSDLQVFPFL